MPQFRSDLSISYEHIRSAGSYKFMLSSGKDASRHLRPAYAPACGLSSTEMSEAGHISGVASSPGPDLRDVAARLAHGSAVYGVANFGIKALGFVLVLAYTHFLTPADYGAASLAETVAII